MQELQIDYDSITALIARWMQKVLSGMGIPENWIIAVKLIILLALVSLSVFVLQFLVRRILKFIFHRVAHITKLSFSNTP